jgi:hypothetical protein
MIERREAKERATAEIAAVLDRIEDRERQPDDWERECLYRALASIFHGAYWLAANDARLALTPGEKRAPQHASDPMLEECDLAFFRTYLQKAEFAPVLGSLHLLP